MSRDFQPWELSALRELNKLDSIKRELARKADAYTEERVRQAEGQIQELQQTAENLALRLETLATEQARHTEEVDRFMRQAETDIAKLLKVRK